MPASFLAQVFSTVLKAASRLPYRKALAFRAGSAPHSSSLVLGPLPSGWETYLESLTPGFGLVQIWLLWAFGT